MTHISSYSEIQHIAHRIIQPMWNEPVEIQEKIDGSQISFMMDENGDLCLRSKGKQLYEEAPGSKMFAEAITSVKKRSDLITPGYIFRGEYLQKPKHNTIKYDRIPNDHIVIFDIELSLGEFATPEQRVEIASYLEYETTPTLFQGVWDKNLTDLKHFLETDSFLGGSKIEGVVVKSYTQFFNGKPMMGKLVSDNFKEVHNKEWKKNNPTKKDVIEQLIERYRTEARWRKSIQHLRDEGLLTDSPKDIGLLLKEVSQDVLKEEEEVIKEELFKLAWPQISRGINRGFPEFYKEYLLEE